MRRIRSELYQTVARPSRLKHLFNRKQLQRYIKFQKLHVMSVDNWSESHDGALRRRRYENYEDYISVQTSKLEYLDLDSHEKRFRDVLRARLQDLEFVRPGQNVICLGARLGGEVRAFQDLGCFAVGIDLNPGPRNRFVLYGDFHDLPMADGSVGIVYTNSIDHAFDLTRMIEEMKRVLQPDGRIILEPDPGTKDAEGTEPDLWAAQNWSTIDSLVEHLSSRSLELHGRRRFEYPRNGEQLIFGVACSQP